MSKPTIPKGWRRLRKGNELKQFDRFWWPEISQWIDTSYKENMGIVGPNKLTYIRRHPNKNKGNK
jgi:hypothetical protein